jgi:hypothetical protein
MTPVQVLERLEEMAPSGAGTPSGVWSAAALLEVLEQRSGDMQTRPVMAEPTRGPSIQSRRRGPLIAAAVAVIVLVVGATAAILTTRGGDDVTTRLPESAALPDLVAEPGRVGEALTVAHASGDTDVYVGLFADDAVLSIDGIALSVEDLRTRYVGWDRVMNRRWEHSACEITDNKGICQVTMTDDWLTPLLDQPFTGEALVEVAEGEITVYHYLGALKGNQFELAGSFSAWTFLNHPDKAERMWDEYAPSYPIFSQESALLHRQLGEEYIARLSP